MGPGSDAELPRRRRLGAGGPGPGGRGPGGIGSGGIGSGRLGADDDASWADVVGARAWGQGTPVTPGGYLAPEADTQLLPSRRAQRRRQDAEIDPGMSGAVSLSTGAQALAGGGGTHAVGSPGGSDRESIGDAPGSGGDEPARPWWSGGGTGVQPAVPQPDGSDVSWFGPDGDGLSSAGPATPVSDGALAGSTVTGSTVAEWSFSGAHFSEPAFEQRHFSEPAFEQPRFSEPAFEQRHFSEPAFEQPRFSEPAFEQPRFSEPAVAARGFADSEPWQPTGVVESALPALGLTPTPALETALEPDAARTVIDLRPLEPAPAAVSPLVDAAVTGAVVRAAAGSRRRDPFPLGGSEPAGAAGLDAGDPLTAGPRSPGTAAVDTGATGTGANGTGANGTADTDATANGLGAAAAAGTADPALPQRRSRAGRSRREPAAPLDQATKAGRNLPAAIAVGLLLAGLAVGSLMFRKEAFVGLVSAAVVVAVWELSVAMQAKRVSIPVPPLAVGAVGMLVSAFVAGPPGLLVAFALSAFGVLLYRVIEGFEGAVRDVAAGVFTAAYVPFLAAFSILLLAADDGAGRVLVFILVTVCNDVGGYVAGVLFGRHPMAPTVSPKKSWEGFAGSAVTCIVAATVSIIVLLDGPWWAGLAVGAAAAVTATLGDLSESLLKRDLGVKDMGTLLPGHGGIMDRLDSLLPTAPVVYLLLTYLIPPT